MSDGVNPAIFVDEGAAEQWLVESRWPDGVFCPRCYCTEIRRVEGREMPFRCHCCRRHFSVTTGTPLHSCNLNYRQIALAFHLMAAGADLDELNRLLGVSKKAAWNLAWKVSESWSEGE